MIAIDPRRSGLMSREAAVSGGGFPFASVLPGQASENTVRSRPLSVDFHHTRTR
jgi:hypothetical protein